MRARMTALAGLAVLTAGAATTALASTASVRVGSFYFEDSSAGDGRVVIDKGDQITFRFEGSQPHTATVDGMFSSGTRSSNDTYTTQPLTIAGTFTLYCEVHGAGQHSTRLIIRDPASPVPSPSSAPAPSPSPTRKPTPAPTRKPSPAPTRKPSPAASPRPSPTPTPGPSRSTPTPEPTPSSAPTSSPAAAPSTTPRSSPSPRATASAAAARPSPSPSPSSDVAGAPADVAPAAPLDSGGPSWLLPGVLLLLLVLLGAGAIALGRRRRVL